jgi:hypothetical protein
VVSEDGDVFAEDAGEEPVFVFEISDGCTVITICDVFCELPYSGTS